MRHWHTSNAVTAARDVYITRMKDKGITTKRNFHQSVTISLSRSDTTFTITIRLMEKVEDDRAVNALQWISSYIA